MSEIAWIGLNGLVGAPLALASLVIARESVRALVGLSFGFRIFEIGWGIGRPLLDRPLGPIDFRLGALPLAGTAIAASGSPRRHRAARFAMACAPLLLQIGWLVWSRTSQPTPALAIAHGPAPWAMLELANAGLVALHLLIPFETRAGVRSDVRIMLELAFGRAGSDRSARADYYARLARHRLERAEVTGARKALDQGLTQLGREPLLVDCEARLGQTDLSSVVDQGACADALRDLIDRAEADRSRLRASASIGERLFRGAILALPPGLAMVALLGVESDRLAQHLQDRWLHESDAILGDGDSQACAFRIEQGSIWTGPFARIVPDDPERQRDRHQRLARLERCRGGIEAAAAHLTLALAAADKIRTEHAVRRSLDPLPWLLSELEYAKLFCEDADLANERGEFRAALASLARAESALDLVRNRVTTWTDAESRLWATERIHEATGEIASTRTRVLAKMTTL